MAHKEAAAELVLAPMALAIPRATQCLAVHLTPAEQEKLLLVVAGELAGRRRSRGLRLNYPESVAFIAAAVLEQAREGKGVAEVVEIGATLLSHDDVMEGVAALLHEVQVEATFEDGTKLVTIHDPIR